MKNIYFFTLYYLYNFFYSKVISNFSLVFYKSLYKKKWSQFKQKNTSDIILIVGNGPSLSSRDLEKLKNLNSIASNKISLLFNDTNWRPKIFTIADPLLAFKMRKDNFIHYNNVLVPHHIKFFFKDQSKTLPFKGVSINKFKKQYEKNKAYFPDPLKNGFFYGATVTIQNIQLALWLGAKKIYLIGMDHSYEEKKFENSKKILHTKQNHFHISYREPGEVINSAPIEKMNRAFSFINIIAQDLNVDIINISKKTKLKIFKQMKINELFN